MKIFYKLRTSRLSKSKSRVTNWDAPQGQNIGQTLQVWMKRKKQPRNGAKRISNTLSKYWRLRHRDSPKAPAVSMVVPLNRLVRPVRSERGMASLVITVVLISLLSAMAVAFAVIMNRELQKSVNNQLGQAAYNAAASGINDSISYLRDNPNTNVTQCQDLLGPGKPLSLSSDLSGDGSTKYTCALINTQPLSLVYQTIPADGSQVIQASLSGPASKFMFSWQASSRPYNNFIPPVQAGQLFDETYWKAHKYAPMLKVSLYPVPADTKDANFASANSRTYYLYPIGPTGFSVNTMSYDTPPGTLKPVECGLKNNNGQFNGNGGFDCNLIITNLPSSNPAGYIYYIRLTPLYTAADVEIRANDGTPASGEVGFISTQAIIDVTAQSASAVKRLQARVDISGLNGTSQNISASDNNFPEYALRSANTVCKRLQNPGSPDLPVYLDPNSINYCSSDLGGLEKLKPPAVTISCSAAGQNNGNCSGTVDPNNGKVTYCHFSNSDGQGSDCPTTSAPGTSPYDVSWSIGSLSAGSSYTVTLCADNPAGRSSPCASDSFTTESPPPPPPDPGGGAGPWLLTFNWNSCPPTNNCYNFTGTNLSSCSLHTDNPAGGVVDFFTNPTGGSVTAGNGKYISDAWLQCGSSNILHVGGVAVLPSPISVTLKAVWYQFSDRRADYLFWCRDELHNYVICVSWQAPGATTCVLSVNNSDYGARTFFGSDINNYPQRITLGWSRDPRGSSTVTVTMSCLNSSTGQSGQQSAYCWDSVSKRPTPGNGNSCSTVPPP